jgi:hypothetical protein
MMLDENGKEGVAPPVILLYFIRRGSDHRNPGIKASSAFAVHKTFITGPQCNLRARREAQF